ncbi:hypothetical protein EDC37_11335 [Pectinatus cerevisiiphilus]|uniref:Uncharacterized protein n=1 Tax=Pectinatus cerevisiiphilus TaxID=86956 RepID=A0A4R3K4R6_9FIRM|nr:hypothetical protein EDC37_11335 [Pectinatus cerevisiiphilus]
MVNIIMAFACNRFDIETENRVRFLVPVFNFSKLIVIIRNM